MKILSTSVLTFLSAFAALAAAPRAENVSLSQADNGMVTIVYDLIGSDGVVTLDIQTNVTDGVWASIGSANFASASGDVGVLVAAGSGKKIVWRPRRDWPDRKIAAGEVRAVLTTWAKSDPPDYMVVDLTQTAAPRYYASSNDVPNGVTDDLYKTDRLVLRKIPAAGHRFRAGSPKSDKPHEGGREVAHMVTLTKDFYLGVYPVTQAQWKHVTGNVLTTQPAYAGPKRPVPTVSTVQVCGSDHGYPKDKTVAADSFIGLLREKTNVSSFYIPTQAQWEFACRAGTTTHILWGEDPSRIPEFAWCEENSDGRQLHDVGLKLPNPWGLYDMIGLVEELCANWWLDFDGTEFVDPEGPEDPPESGVTPLAPNNSPRRAVCGGCYWREATACRAAFVSGCAAEGGDYSNGVRVMCDARAY